MMHDAERNDACNAQPFWEMVEAARARKMVRLDNGRIATLTYWPIPDEIRSSTRKRHPRKATVQFPNGNYANLACEKITGLVDNR